MKPDRAIERVERKMAIAGLQWGDPTMLECALNLLRHLNERGSRKIFVPCLFQVPMIWRGKLRKGWPVKYGQVAFMRRDLEIYTATRILESDRFCMSMAEAAALLAESAVGLGEITLDLFRPISIARTC